MRILRVAQHVYPDTKGGGQYHVHAMSRDQAAMGHDVTVLTTRVDESLPRVEHTHGYRIVRVSPGLPLGRRELLEVELGEVENVTVAAASGPDGGN